jgi:hypothetical protein
MTDEDETADPVKGPSRRDRLKGVLGRTKTRFRKKGTEDDGDVEDFLAAGRNSTSTGRPSISDSLSFADSTPPSHSNPDTLAFADSVTSDKLNFADTIHSSARPSTSDSSDNIRKTIIPYPEDDFVSRPQQSPRRIVVPRIDVSRSQRYPAAQTFEQQKQDSINSFLKPQYQARSQSASSLSKGRGRARGLSVTFTEAPPVVIGEGGDRAQAPTIDISKTKARARSVSPTPTPRSAEPSGRQWSISPWRRKPAAEPLFSPVKEEPGFVSPGLRRVPTSFSPTDQDRPLDKEFEMSMALGSASTNSAGSTNEHQAPFLHAPKPVHPPVSIPSVREHELKPASGDDDLRSRFSNEEPDPPNPFADSNSDASNRFYAMHPPSPGPRPGQGQPRGRSGHRDARTGR